MFQITPCTKTHIFWKVHENLLTCFPVMLVTDRQMNRGENFCNSAEATKLQTNTKTPVIMILKPWLIHVKLIQYSFLSALGNFHPAICVIPRNKSTHHAHVFAFHGKSWKKYLMTINNAFIRVSWIPRNHCKFQVAMDNCLTWILFSWVTHFGWRKMWPRHN